MSKTLRSLFSIFFTFFLHRFFIFVRYVKAKGGIKGTVKK